MFYKNVYIGDIVTEQQILIVKLVSEAETLELDPTDGTEMIGEARDLFTGYVDSGFANFGLNVKSQPTKKRKVAVHELFKNGTFAKIFGGLSDNLDKLRLTQPQIIQFVKKYRKWLRTDGYATLFLFKVRGKFFVVYVGLHSDGRLYVHVDRFSHSRVWRADGRFRVVVRKL